MRVKARAGRAGQGIVDNDFFRIFFCEAPQFFKYFFIRFFKVLIKSILFLALAASQWKTATENETSDTPNGMNSEEISEVSGKRTRTEDEPET